MSLLVDSLTLKFEARVEHERAQMTAIFQKLLREQRDVTVTLETKIQTALV